MSSSSIRRSDLLALCQLRPDGRRPDELRRLQVQMGVAPASAGSVIVEMGLTVVLVTCDGPSDCTRRSDEQADRATLQVSLQAAPFSRAGDRKATNPRTDRGLLELSRQVQRALEAVILLHLYPKSSLRLSITILADDGGRLPACLNACTLALVDAGIALKDLLCACSAGLLNTMDSSNTNVLLDLNRSEETQLTAGQPTVVMPCAVLPQRGTVVLTSLSQSRVSNLQVLETILEAALGGCRMVFDILQAAVRDRAKLVLAARQGRAALVNTVPPVAAEDEKMEMD